MSKRSYAKFEAISKMTPKSSLPEASAFKDTGEKLKKVKKVKKKLKNDKWLFM